MFLRTSSEYSSEYLRYGQGSVFKISFQGSVVKTDPCLYFFEYSPDVLDIFNTDKKCFTKINIETSPQEIWITFSQRIWIPITGLKLCIYVFLCIATTKYLIYLYYLVIHLFIYLIILLFIYLQRGQIKIFIIVCTI